MAKHRITIRMGAAHWDAQVNTGEADPLHFDIRKMDGSQRGTFFHELRKACRSVVGGGKKNRRHQKSR